MKNLLEKRDLSAINALIEKGVTKEMGEELSEWISKNQNDLSARKFFSQILEENIHRKGILELFSLEDSAMDALLYDQGVTKKEIKKIEDIGKDE